MKKSRFFTLILLLTGIGLLAGGLIASASNELSIKESSQEKRQKALSKVSSWVIEKTAHGAEAEFIAVLNDQADLSGADLLATKAEKGRYVYETLRAKAEATQAPLLDWLNARRVEHRSFYIVNAVMVKANQEIAIEIASREEIKRIEGNPSLRGVNPIAVSENEAANLKAEPAAIESGVSYIRAPEVWAAGFTGQGITIGGQDTGVRWDHPALRTQYRGWDGSNANHDYNWHDSIHSNAGPIRNECGTDSKTPCDDDNHGTHTLGTAVGTDGGSNQIGVAPGAKFMACRNMDRGNGTPATYLECFQFFLAPYPVNGTPAQGDPGKAPDITTNSWSCPPSEGCEPNTLKAAVEAQQAAGIMTIVAAGNNGAACSTVVDPPAIYDASYSVGALSSSTGLMASFSSRGPVSIDGSNRIKPDISAPGVSVRSAVRSGSYSFLSGTSMATPHVAGAAALLWSAFPDLRGQIQLTENILNESAVRVETSDCSSNGFPNNIFGFGRLDIKAAFDLAATGLFPTSQAFGIRGGLGRVEVNALSGVAWRAVSNDSWITITSGATGVGPGIIDFAVEPNTSANARAGSLMIAGRLFHITQPGVAPLFEVSGQVKTSTDASLGRVTLTFSRVSGGGDLPGPVLTDDNGNWSQSGFEPGTTYRVIASRTRMTFAPNSIDFSAANSALNFTSVNRRVVSSGGR